MKKKTITRFMQFLAITYLIIVIGVYALQKYIIFQPKNLDTDFEFSFENPYEEYFLETKDSVTLNVLLFKTDLPRKGLVLYFHGNADNLQRWGKYHSDFTLRGYDVVMPDFRGYGKSTGTPDEKKIYEDARMIYNWVLEKYQAEDIIIYGRSLGCGVGSNLATEVSVKKLILETPFFNVHELFTTQSSILLLPFNLKYDFPNHKNLSKIQEPIFIFAGGKDKIVPKASTKKLKPLLKPSDQYIEIEDGGHKNLNTFEKYHQALDLILQ